MVPEGWAERADALVAQLYALSLAYRHPRTPARAKLVIVLTLGYAVSPIDPIPDFLPGIGYLDELVVLPLGVMLALRLTPDEVVDACRERADEELDAGAARWVAAGVVLLLWAALGALALRVFTSWS